MPSFVRAPLTKGASTFTVSATKLLDTSSCTVRLLKGGPCQQSDDSMHTFNRRSTSSAPCVISRAAELLTFFPFLTLTTMPNVKNPVSATLLCHHVAHYRLGNYVFVGLVFFQDDKVVQKATSVACESVLKMALYYFHERAWYRYGKLGRS